MANVEGYKVADTTVIKNTGTGVSPSGSGLEAVIVCSKYDDFLRQTLPENKFLFDKIVVVTDHEDAATRRVCEFYHVECIPTDVLNTRKGQFCKGAGINVGLNALVKNGWVVQVDADIWLPPQTRNLLNGAKLDPKMVYGIDRFIVKGPKAWHDFREREVIKLQHEDYTWVHTDAFPIGTRVCGSGGYLPIGFFQLWNPSATGVTTYPEGHTTAAREDFSFASQWKRSERSLIPEIIGYHLESDDSDRAINWEGRKSARFVR